MSWFLAAVLIVGGVLLSGFFSGAETGLYCINRLRLQVRVNQRDPRALRLAGVLADEQGALFVTLVGTNLMNYITTTTAAYLFARMLHFSEGGTELYTVLCVTPLLFVFGEVVPKNLFQLHADTLMMHSNRLLVVANRVFRLTGIVWFLKRFVALLSRLAGGQQAYPPLSPLGNGGLQEVSEPKRRIAMLLREGLAETAHAAGQPEPPAGLEMIDRICMLSEMPLHAVMVPRNHVVTIVETGKRSDLLRIARAFAYRRVPVLQEVASAPAAGGTPRGGRGGAEVSDALRPPRRADATSGMASGAHPGRGPAEASDSAETAFQGRRNAAQVVGLIDVDALLDSGSWNTVAERVQPMRSLSREMTVAAALSSFEEHGMEMAVVTDAKGNMLGIVTLQGLVEKMINPFTPPG